MERPDPNQLPPEYTGPEAPVADPEMLEQLEQQDLRYGMIELTGNIQKIVESGNEEAVGDYLKEVIDGKNESVSPNERRAAFELLASEELGNANQRTISIGKDVVDGLIETDDFTGDNLRADELAFRGKFDEANNLFGANIRAKVDSENYDKYVMEVTQREFRGLVELSSFSMEEVEQNMESWVSRQQAGGRTYLESYEMRQVKEKMIEDAKKSLLPGYEGREIELGSLISTEAIDATTQKLNELASQESEDAAVEYLENSNAGSEETETLIESLYAFATHRLTESELSGREVERLMKELKRHKTGLIGSSHGFDGRRDKQEEESFAQQEQYYLGKFQNEADGILNYVKRKLKMSGLNNAEASQTISRHLHSQEIASRPS